MLSLAALAPHTRLVTDDWPSYRDVPGVRHNAITLGPMAAHIVLPWIHRLFSNLKRWGPGGLPRTAENKPPALPRRVRVPLQSTPHPACRVPDAARHRRPHGTSSLPPADPQDRLVNARAHYSQYVEPPDRRT